MFKANLNPYNETLPLTQNRSERAIHAKHDNFKFEHLGYYQLIDNGTYYYPAWKHYNRKTKVFCDRCYRQNLRACIGYAHYDLCLLCVDELTRLNFDCPSRHCHESKFINDNAVSFSRPEYVDLNRYYYHQQYDNKPETENKENLENIENKIEHFSIDNLKKSDNNNLLMGILIVIIIILVFINDKSIIN